MDPYSSGEDLVIKTRKPYTITKQRERWTEDEHNRFLEALKLHGRAWQRIEEHIGTKTAVQIRSHAQKFFTKLEKEATVKGVPIGHDLDIEIPPPRPKKKPSNPYPRKSSVGDPTSLVTKDGKISNSLSVLCQSKMTVSMENEPEKPSDDGKLGNSNEYHGKENCSKAFTLLKMASPSSTNEETSLSVSDAPGKSCNFRQYIPLPKDTGNQDEAAASQVTIESKGPQAKKSDDKKPLQDNPPFNISNAVDSYLSHVHTKRIDELKQCENVDASPTADVQGSQNYPRHVHVHILDGSPGVSVQTVSQDITHTGSMFHQMGGGSHGHQNLFMNAAEHYSSASGTSSVHQSFPSYHHPIFTPNQNQDDYQSSFLNISSTFSSLIVSALSQNLAAYAAASFAATMWPFANMEAPTEPSTASAGSFQSRHLNSVPSMAGIAAATVAAATAWWSAHGLLPLSPPFHPGFTYSPASEMEMDCSQGRVVNSERRENSSHQSLGGQQLEPECSEALHEQRSVLKSPVLSSSDSEASGSAKLNIGSAAAETAKVLETAELDDDANKSKNQKLVDRSSCGSNTPSSSDVEAEAANGEEEKHVQDNEEQEELDAIHSIGDPFNRRCRSISNINDSWKEVSEEGRLAFRALFSREVLPQSFSPPHMDKKNLINKDNESGKERDEGGLQLDLNGATWDTCSQEREMEDNATLVSENKESGLLNIGLGHSKLKARRTGFKPYKRCSMEAKESMVSTNCHDEEKCPKRLRVEGEASP